jgi:hypothetical protein
MTPTYACIRGVLEVQLGGAVLLGETHSALDAHPLLVGGLVLVHRALWLYGCMVVWVYGCMVVQTEREWCMVCGVWCMVYGVWCMVYGVWCTVCGVWCMVYGVWCMVYGVWCMMYGVWCMVYGV